MQSYCRQISRISRLGSHGPRVRHSSSYVEATQGIWKSISESSAVSCMQDGLIAAHDLSGLPWWATIVLTTVFLRATVTFPLTIYQHKIMGRLEKISGEMPAIVEEMKREMAVAIRKFNLNEAQAKALFFRSSRKQWNKLVLRENCHPAKTAITVWVQIPLWIIQSVSIRNMVSLLPASRDALESQIVYSDLMVGGFLWIPNLTVPDESWILPVALGIVNLAVIEIQSAIRKRDGVEPSKFSKYITNFFRVLSVLMVPVAASVPSALSLYWVTSSSFGLVQNLAMLSPKVRNVFGVPHLAHLPKEKPWEFVVDKLMRRTSNSQNK